MTPISSASLRRVTAAALAAAFLALAAPSPSRAGDDDFDAAVARARGEAVLEHPAASLAAYREALAAAAGDPMRVRVADFGIARMQFWLERYDDADATYAALLAMPLSTDDREIALDGRVRCLLALDRPQSAAHVVRDDAAIASPRLALAVAHAAEAGGAPERARAILARHRTDVDALTPGSRLASEARDVADAVRRETDVRIDASHAYAHDSDGETTNDTTLALRQPLPSGDVATYRARQLALSGGTGPAARATAIGSTLALHPTDTLELTLGGDLADFGGWSPTFVAASLAYRPTDALRIGAFGNGSAVETQLGVADRTRATQFGVDLTARPNDVLTIDGSTYATRYSDDNRRVGYYAAVTANVPAVAGLGLTLRARGFADRETPGTGYFSPLHFREQQLLVGERVRAHGWTLSGTAGIGRETVAPSAPSTTTLFGIGARGPVGGCLRLDASASDSDSALASTSGYQRFAAALFLTCAT